MVVCSVCKGKEFSNEAGLYFCNDCHTQVEGWREADTEFGHAFTLGTTSLRFASQSTVLGTQNTDNEPVKKDVWTTWEALNLILYNQVNELEHLPGVAPSLRFIVLSLWTQYLHLKGLAFIMDKKIPWLDIVECKRDLCAVTSTVLTKSKRRRRRTSSAVEDSYSDVSGWSQKSNSQLTLSQSQQFDTRSISSFTESDTSCYSNRLSLTSDLVELETKLNTPKRQKKSDIWHREKLVAFLYLGLILSRSEAQLADLLRWIRDGHISYLNIRKILPEEFELQNMDDKIFGTYLFEPPVTAIQTSVIDLQSLLKVQEIPEPDLNLLTARYITELKLPDDLNVLCKKLLFKCNLGGTAQKRFCMRFECIAMAYIIVTLKLLYGLDGITEHQISRAAQHINMKQPSVNLFVWDEWVQFIEYRNAVLADKLLWFKQQHDPLGPCNPSHLSTRNKIMKEFFERRVMSERTQKILQSQLDDLSEVADTFLDDLVPASLYPINTSFNHFRDLSHVVPDVVAKDYSKCSINEISIQDANLKTSTENMKISDVESVEKEVTVSVMFDPSIIIENNFKILNDFLTDQHCLPKHKYWNMPKPSSASMSKLPPSFLWLLKQCASLINDSTKNLCLTIESLEIELTYPLESDL